MPPPCFQNLLLSSVVCYLTNQDPFKRLPTSLWSFALPFLLPSISILYNSQRAGYIRLPSTNYLEPPSQRNIMAAEALLADTIQAPQRASFGYLGELVTQTWCCLFGMPCISTCEHYHAIHHGIRSGTCPERGTGHRHGIH